MTDGEALLKAIVDNPDDDTPRLVYADWLDEQGRHDRAEFIRVQCELARTEEDDPGRDQLLARETALLDGHRKEWTAPVERVLGKHITATGAHLEWHWPSSTRFSRGFIHRLSLELPAFLRGDELLFQEIPTAQAVHVWAIRGRMKEFADCPALGYLRELELGGQEGLTAADIRTLFTSPHLPFLRVLHLPGNPIGDEGVAVLAASAAMTRLQSLRLPQIGAGPASARALADSPHLTQLQRLSFWHDDLGPTATAALLASPNLSHLEVLKLERCGVGDEGALALAQSPHLRRLRTLVLPENGLTDVAVESLAASPNMAQLRVLNLRSNRFGTASVRALARSPHLSGLKTLDLAGTRLDADGVVALVESPYLKGLARLNLQGNGLLGSSLHALWERFRDRVYL